MLWSGGYICGQFCGGEDIFVADFKELVLEVLWPDFEELVIEVLWPNFEEGANSSSSQDASAGKAHFFPRLKAIDYGSE